MSTTLEVILKTAGFTEGATAIKKVGDEATNTNNKLKTTTSTVDQVSKSTTSLGSKLANAGKQFSGTITNVAALGSTVVNLSRQYSDLSDTQIRVDRTQLKVSRSAEAVRAAQTKLNTVVKQYGASSAEAQKAQLDLTQAQDASTLAVTMNGEALEDQQRAYENFAMSLAPTVLTAGSSITSMFKEMGGDKGMGGFASKLQSLPGMSKMSMTSVAANIGLITAAAGVAVIGIQKIFDLMEQKKAIMEGMAKITGGKATPTDIQNEIDRVKKNQADWATQFRDFMAGGPLGKAIFGSTVKEIGDQLIKEWDSLKSRLESQNMMIGLLNSVMGVKADPTVNNELKSKIIDQIKNILAIFSNKNNWDTTKYGTIEQVRANTVKILTEAMTNLQSDVSLVHIINQVPVGLTGALKDAFLKHNPFAGLMGETLVTAINAAPTTGSDWIGAAKANIEAKLAAGASAGFGAKIGTTKGISASVDIDADHVKKVLDDIAKASQDAADKYQAAWDKAFGAQSSGIDKIFAAYHKLHPGSTQDIMKKGKKIGERTFEPGKLPIDIAQKALEQLESGMAQLISSPKSAETWAQNWVKTAGSKLGGVAGQLIKPINDYIKAHSSEAPDVFMSGFVQFLSSFNLTDEFSKAFLPVVTVAEDTAGKTTDALGKITVPPAATASVTGLDKAIKAIPPKTVPSVTAKVIGTTQVNALTNAIAHVKSKTVTVTVKAQLDKQLNAVLPGATRNVQRFVSGKQHGYSGTVKRPTMFMAGEGGRHEDVTVRPKGSVQRGGSAGGGGFNGIINVYVDGVLRPARYDMGARK